MNLFIAACFLRRTDVIPAARWGNPCTAFDGRPPQRRIGARTIFGMRLLCLALICSAVPHPAIAATTVILVRHAEKAKDQPSDPNLAPAGKTRATALARMLRSVPLSAIYTTSYRRTRQTAEPTAQKFKIQTTEYRETSDLVDRIRKKHRNQSILVVGHSNTLPVLLSSFGISNPMKLSDSNYDNVFFVQIDEQNRASLLHLHFGADDPL